jgi:hypothetical protein
VSKDVYSHTYVHTHTYIHVHTYTEQPTFITAHVNELIFEDLSHLLKETTHHCVGWVVEFQYTLNREIDARETKRLIDGYF